MHLSTTLLNEYTHDSTNSHDALFLAALISFGPIVFKVAYLMKKWGIFQQLEKGSYTEQELAADLDKPIYAIKILLEASLTVGTVKVNAQTNRYMLSQAGWFLLHQSVVAQNMDVTEHLAMPGLDHIEQSLLTEEAVGLSKFTTKDNIFDAMQELPRKIQECVENMQHFFGSYTMKEALPIIFARRLHKLLIIGSQKAECELACVAYDPQVEVTVMDYPKHIPENQEHIKGKTGAGRIKYFSCNFFKGDQLPQNETYDAIYLNHVLSNFTRARNMQLLEGLKQLMSAQSSLFILQPLSDNEEFDFHALNLTQLSIISGTMINGGTKNITSEEVMELIQTTGLYVVQVRELAENMHTLLEVRKL